MPIEINLYRNLMKLLKEPLNSHRHEKVNELWKDNAILRDIFFDMFYEVISGESINDELRGKMKIIEKNNSEIWKNLNLDFIYRFGNIFTIEQLLRITEYPGIQHDILLLSNHKILYNLLLYILKNDNSWIISLKGVLNNLLVGSINDRREYFREFTELIDSISEIPDEKISDEIMEIFATIISANCNYFNIKNFDDLLNYEQKKNRICLSLLEGNKNITLSNSLKGYTEKELYKFALLEYKFGISLKEAIELVKKYGEDAEKLPNGIVSDFIKLLKEIVNNEDIIDIVNGAIKKDILGNSWKGFPTAREAEGKILNLFAELYNNTLYKPIKDDKEELPEFYIDQNGNQHSIEVYKIKKDFNMCVRREGAFHQDELLRYSVNTLINNYTEFYNQRNILHHGNSESFIGNDCIAIVNAIRIIVGYEHIFNNQFAGGSTKVMSRQSREGIVTVDNGDSFSIYNIKNMVVRTPKEMLDNTRMNGTYKGKIVNFNEILKDRIYLNENDEVSKYQPKYVVWVEEDTEEAREKISWKEDREKDPLWIETKKAAAQLGIPIVIIDREYFAKREMKKIELMKKLVLEEAIDEDEYSEFLPDYQNLDKPTIIKRIFTTIENNRTGLMTNKELAKKYFTQDFRVKIGCSIFDAIEKMNKEEATNCLNALKEVAEKELSFDVSFDYKYMDDYVNNNLQYYESIKQIAETALNKNNTQKKEEKQTDKKHQLLLMYLESKVDRNDLSVAQDCINEKNKDSQIGQKRR